MFPFCLVWYFYPFTSLTVKICLSSVRVCFQISLSVTLIFTRLDFVVLDRPESFTNTSRGQLSCFMVFLILFLQWSFGQQSNTWVDCLLDCIEFIIFRNSRCTKPLCERIKLVKYLWPRLKGNNFRWILDIYFVNILLGDTLHDHPISDILDGVFVSMSTKLFLTQRTMKRILISWSNDLELHNQGL